MSKMIISTVPIVAKKFTIAPMIPNIPKKKLKIQRKRENNNWNGKKTRRNMEAIMSNMIVGLPSRFFLSVTHNRDDYD